MDVDRRRKIQAIAATLSANSAALEPILAQEKRDFENMPPGAQWGERGQLAEIRLVELEFARRQMASAAESLTALFRTAPVRTTDG